jgi:hypothetical protein
LIQREKTNMRASFHGQSILILGNGIARLHTPPVVADEPVQDKDTRDQEHSKADKSRLQPKKN